MESKLKQKLFIGRILGLLYYEDFSPFLDQIMLNQNIVFTIDISKRKRKKKTDLKGQTFWTINSRIFMELSFSKCPSPKKDFHSQQVVPATSALLRIKIAHVYYYCC